VEASLPGYASVARASEVLHLAPRSVRDLIYSGRLPSLRIGRLHYLKVSDLDLERRRRLGLPPPRPRKPHVARPRAVSAERPRVDPSARRRRAAERAAQVSRWAQRHPTAMPRVPFEVVSVTNAPEACEACGRTVRSGEMLRAAAVDGRLCTTCGRRALLEWADQRRLEAVAARRMSEQLGARRPAAHAASPEHVTLAA
jgi:hypothetical protein